MSGARGRCAVGGPGESGNESGDESGNVAHRARGVGVNRPRHREGARHGDVAPRREQHGDKAHRVRERDHAVARVKDKAEHRDRGDRRDHDQTIGEQVDDLEAALQFLLVPERLKRAALGPRIRWNVHQTAP